jgi:predicted peptidase
MKSLRQLSLILIASFFSTIVFAAEFGYENFKVDQLGTLPYRILLPKNFDALGGDYPLLIFLHGAGERGTDNEAQLTHGKQFLANAADQYGCIVVAPQCPKEKLWGGHHWTDEDLTLTNEPSVPMQILDRLIDSFVQRNLADPDKIYIMGISMGGFGTWEAIQRWPNRFAAAAPVCGGADVARAKSIAKVPIWDFHGELDSAVPVDRSRKMVEALKKACSKVKYTEYPGVHHGSWVNAFAEPGVLDWMSQQKRPSDR